MIRELVNTTTTTSPAVKFTLRNRMGHMPNESSIYVTL